MADQKSKSSPVDAEESSENLTAFDYKSAPAKSEDDTNSGIERSDRDKKKKQEVPAEQAVPIKGQGERVLNFEFEEEFSPVLKIFGKDGQELAFDLKEKVTLGSDSTKAKIVVEHQSIAPLHCVFGVKDRDVLIKHNASIPIIVRGKKLDAGKTYKLPFDTRIKLAELLFAEVSATRPLGLEAVKLNKDWKLEFKDNSDEFRGTTENLSARQRIEEEKRKRGFVGRLFAAIFDPRDEQDLEEEFNDEESDWVTEEEWKNAPEEEKKGKKVLKEGEIIDRNFRQVEKKKIKQANVLVRPFLKFFHNFKDEFSFFENQSKKDLNKQLEYSKRCLEMRRVQHLAQKNIIPQEAAQKLAKVGVQSIAEVSNLPAKKLSAVLKVDEKEAAAIKEKVTEAIKTGAVAKTDKNITAMEKRLMVNENKVQTKIKHLQIAGPLKRIFGAIVTHAFIFSAYFFLIDREEVRPFVEGILGNIISMLDPEVIKEWEKVFKELHEFMIYVLFHVSLQLFFHLLFGTSIGQYLLGLKNGRGIVGSRLLGMVRYIIGLVLAPFLIFDLPMLFRYKTLKEILTFNTLVRREARSVVGELLGVMITGSSLVFATYLLIEQRPWQKIPKQLEIPTEAKEQLLALVPAEVWQQPFLRDLGLSPATGDLSQLNKAAVVKLGKGQLHAGNGEYRKASDQPWRPINAKKGFDLAQGTSLRLPAGAMLEIQRESLPAWHLQGPVDAEISAAPGSSVLVVSLHSQQLRYRDAKNVLVRSGPIFASLNGAGQLALDVMKEYFVLVPLMGNSYVMVDELAEELEWPEASQLKALESGDAGHVVAGGCVIQGHRALSTLSVPVRIDYAQFKALSQVDGPEYGCQTTVDYEGKVDIASNLIVPVPGGVVDFATAQYIAPKRTGGLQKNHMLYQDADLSALVDPASGMLKESPGWMSDKGIYRTSEKELTEAPHRRAFEEMLKSEAPKEAKP